MGAKVAIIMGSKNDLKLMDEARAVLADLGIEAKMFISSAHRTPEMTARIVSGLEADGYEVVIAGTGAAAHLAGVIAAHTILPVIAVPINATALLGLDSLLAMVQMPSGIPVATMAIDGATNAGIFAAQIVANKDPEVKAKLIAHRAAMSKKVEEDNASLGQKG